MLLSHLTQEMCKNSGSCTALVQYLSITPSLQDSWTLLLTLNPEFVMYHFMVVCVNGGETLNYSQITDITRHFPPGVLRLEV